MGEGNLINHQQITPSQSRKQLLIVLGTREVGLLQEPIIQSKFVLVRFWVKLDL